MMQLLRCAPRLPEDGCRDVAPTSDLEQWLLLVLAAAVALAALVVVVSMLLRRRHREH